MAGDGCLVVGLGCRVSWVLPGSPLGYFKCIHHRHMQLENESPHSCYASVCTDCISFGFLQISLVLCFVLMFGNSMLLTSYYASSLVIIWVSIPLAIFLTLFLSSLCMYTMKYDLKYSPYSLRVSSELHVSVFVVLLITYYVQLICLAVFETNRVNFFITVLGCVGSFCRVI